MNADRITEVSGVSANEAIIDKAFATRDGYIEISPVFTDNALRDISVAIGLDDLSRAPQFSTHALQREHARDLNRLLAARFREKTTTEWLAELEPKGVFCARINTVSEAASDPQVNANGMVVEMEHPEGGKLRLLGNPLRLHGTPPVPHRFASELGQHTREILEELNFSEEAITDLDPKTVGARNKIATP